MSLLLAAPDVPIVNNEPGPIFSTPAVLPADSPDGYSAFAGVPDLYQPISTNQNFYPIASDPNAVGPNVVTIDGQKYAVTPDNYSAVARMYINSERAKGNKMYDDPTPAAYSTGQATTQGNLNTIALADAYRQLAGLAPVNWSVDPITGVAIPNNQAAMQVLNNPVVKAANAVSNVGTALANNGSSLIQGGSQAITDLAGVIGSIGKFLGSPGTILLVGIGIAGFILIRKKII